MCHTMKMGFYFHPHVIFAGNIPFAWRLESCLLIVSWKMGFQWDVSKGSVWWMKNCWVFCRCCLGKMLLITKKINGL